MLAKIKEDKEYREKLVCGTVLMIAVAMYNFIWLNRSFTMSEGWAKVYVELINRGKLPYRDYYYYLPLFSLLTDYMFWKISFGYFIVFRCLRLIERLVIVLIMYRVVSKKCSYFFSALICFGAAIIGSANVYDLVGDYNQTCQLMIILLCCTLLKYFEDDRKNAKWLVISGIIGGLMLGTKQTVAVACAVVFALMFVILSIAKEEKNILKDIALVIMGAAIPIFIMGIYLIVTNSLSDFIFYVFKDTSAKGSIFDIVIFSQIDIIKNRIPMFIAMILMIAIRAARDFIKNNKLIIQGCSAIVIFIIAALHGKSVLDAIQVNVQDLHICFILLALATIVIFRKKNAITYPIVIAAYAMILILNINGSTEGIYNTGLFDIFGELITYIYIYIVLRVIYMVLHSRITKSKIEVDKLIIASSAIASGYTTSMTTRGGNVITNTAFIAVPALAYLLYEEYFIDNDCKNNREKSVQNLISVEYVLFFVFSICLSQKLVCNYSWWGDTEASYWEKTEKSEIQCLAGFKFSKQEINKFDKLAQIINDNSEEDSFIYSFPYSKVYNIFLNNYNEQTFAPIVFYDVCSDGVAIKEAEMLRKNYPDIVVWLDIPYCMETHERIFRNGARSGQREIQKWFSDVKDTSYTQIGQVDNVFVYKLITDSEMPPRFISRKTIGNATSQYDYKCEMECELQGDGTADRPYLIRSLSDLKYFRNLVNNGYSFEGEHVRQVADIELSTNESWIPIGIFGSSNCFHGTYDGNGYKISNLYISSGDNSGFFGMLYGNVYNLFIDECNITAACTGGITSHGLGCTIANCYVTGNINGLSRCGGIADNTGGNITNCVAIVDIDAPFSSGISGYYTNHIYNCYSNYGNDIDIDDGEKITDETVYSLNKYIKKENKKSYGGMLNLWDVVDDKLTISHKE